MVIALVVVAVLLFIAVVLLSNAFGSVSAENSVRAKIAAFDAAEAGINQVVDALDESHGRSMDCASNGSPNAKGTLADGGAYSWCIQYNAVVSGTGAVVKDRENAKTDINVPGNAVYAWSWGTAQGGGRGVLIEALIAPSNGLPLPSGAIDAAGDVFSRAAVSVYDNAVTGSDASIRANGDLIELVPPRIVQGSTYAAGNDQISGQSGTNSNAAAMTFPSPDQIVAATENAGSEASSVVAVMSPPTGSTVLTGDVYINGDIELQTGTVVFQAAHSVFINGNLCLHGSARIVNDGATIWVNGAVSTVGSRGGYSVAKGSNGMLVALGADTSRLCSNSASKYAVILDSASPRRLGFVYAPNGSIDLAGTGMYTGAIDAGKNVYLDSSNGGGLTYDVTSIRPVPTYDYKIASYMEY